MTGNCPNPECKTPLDRVKVEHLRVEAAGGPWTGVSYICPFCLMVLSVGIDPIALKADIVSEVLEGMEK